MLCTLLIIQLDLPPHPRCICTPFVDIPFDLSNLLHPCIIITTLSLSCIHNVLFPFVLWTLTAHIVICIALFSCEIQCKSSFFALAEKFFTQNDGYPCFIYLLFLAFGFYVPCCCILWGCVATPRNWIIENRWHSKIV